MDKIYQQIIDLQKKATAIDPVYGKIDLHKAILNKSLGEKDIIRRIFSMALRSGALIERNHIYYEMDQISPRVFYWNIKLDKPSDKSFISGVARYKIDKGYHRSYTKPDLNKYVFVDNGDDDYLILFKDEFSLIPRMVSEFSIFTPERQNNKAMREGTKTIIASILTSFPSIFKNKLNFKMKKPTSTFWISFSIILVGLLFCGTYYFVNKDNGRYEYESGLIIDKKS